jgi:hypothetical protein
MCKTLRLLHEDLDNQWGKVFAQLKEEQDMIVAIHKKIGIIPDDQWIKAFKKTE